MFSSNQERTRYASVRARNKKILPPDRGTRDGMGQGWAARQHEASRRPCRNWPTLYFNVCQRPCTSCCVGQSWRSSHPRTQVTSLSLSHTHTHTHTRIRSSQEGLFADGHHLVSIRAVLVERRRKKCAKPRPVKLDRVACIIPGIEGIWLFFQSFHEGVSVRQRSIRFARGRRSKAVQMIRNLKRCSFTSYPRWNKFGPVEAIGAIWAIGLQPYVIWIFLLFISAHFPKMVVLFRHIPIYRYFMLLNNGFYNTPSLLLVYHCISMIFLRCGCSEKRCLSYVC